MDNSIFSGKKFYIIFTNDFSIKPLLQDCGALYQSYLSESVSFAISDSVSVSEVGEAEDIYNVAVVTSEWVRLCLQWGKYQYIKAFHPSVRLLFSQVKFFIANMCKEDKDVLKGYIRVFGGLVADSLTEEVSYVIIGTIEGEAHEEILCQCSSKMNVVTPSWVMESLQLRNMQATTSYQPQVIYERLKSLQISSENERASQIKKAVLAHAPLTEANKRPSSDSIVTICTSAQFTLSGLQQAVPLSIQDSLLTRQLPSNISTRPEQATYQLPPRTVPIPSPKVPTVTTPSLTSSTVITVPTTSTKSKSSKNNNKHLQEQGLNEMEKEAIVMQNVISILGKRTTSTTNIIEKGSVSNTATRKPRSPRPKVNKNQSSTTSTACNVPSKTITQSLQVINPQSNVILSESKAEPQSPQHAPLSIPTSPRYGMLCGLQPSTRPQGILNRSLETHIDTSDLDQSAHVSQLLSKSVTTMSPSTNTVQMNTTPSQAPFQNLYVHHQQQQPIIDPSSHISQLQNRQLRQFQQQQQQQHQQQQQQQQHQHQQQQHLQQQQQRQLITLGQIQATPGQQPQQWQHNNLHMSPNQHSSPSSAASLLSSPAQQGLCAAVPQASSVHHMYQLQQQLNPQQTNYYRWISQLPRTGIINNSNQMMLNNMGANVPLNTSMIANVATPLHLQSSVGNGNPATIMLHQQQLHVGSNLTQSAMHSPNGVQTPGPLTMSSGKIMSGNIPRALLQHSPQLSGVRVPNNSYSMLQSNHHCLLQNGGVTDHNVTHHSASAAHLNRPLSTMLRLPQYVGNEGATSGICRENCLIGCVFFLYGYEEVSQIKKDGWLMSIRSHGGETVSSYNHDTVTHLIVDCQLEDPNLFKMALKYKTRVVTIYWVNDVIDKGHLEPPFEIIHLPSPFSKNLSFSYIKKQIVSITGFEGEERKKMEYMVINLGVKYTEYLEASNTVLICKKISGRKYEAAQKMGIACVNVRWLQDIYFGDLSTLSADIEHKYQSFEPADISIRLERMTPRVQELMVGWIVPVRLDDLSWKKYRLLKDQFEVEKNTRKRQAEVSSLQSSVNAKKLKWQLPSLSVEETELADSCVVKQLRQNVSSFQEEIKFENNDTIDDLLQQNENHQRIFVSFTGLLPEQRDKLADLVASLGGQVTEDMMQCTHLVAKNIIRTPKFYYGVLRGCQIVTMKWIQACAYRQQFIDETPWKLEDKESERQFGFSLELSLQRARSRVNSHMTPLFQSLEFFLSPRAKHRQICMDLIRACGGIIREKRPIQKMALLTEPRHLIICHEDDSHLANYLTRTKTGNKAVHHEEFVLSCVMRQELDFDSYQIQYVSVIKNAFNNQSLTTNNAIETSTTISRDSPSRSAVSDSTADTADTHVSQQTESVPQPMETNIKSTSLLVENTTNCSLSSIDKSSSESVEVKVEEVQHDFQKYTAEVSLASFVEPSSSGQEMSQAKLENLLLVSSHVPEELNM